MAFELASLLAETGANVLGNVLNFLGTKETNKTNQSINRESLQAQKDLLQYQNQFTEDMWNKNNEYNSPGNQRRLLEQAGLNPFMMMKGTSGMQAQQVTSNSASVPSSIPAQAPHFDLSGVSDAVNSFYDNRIKSEQAYQLGIASDFKYDEVRLNLLEQRERILNSKLDRKTKNREIKVLDDRLKWLAATYKYRVNQERSTSNLVSAQYEAAEWSNFWNTITSNLDYRAKEQGINLTDKELHLADARLHDIYENMKDRRTLTLAQAAHYGELVAKDFAERMHNKKLYPLIRQEVISQIRKNRSINYTDRLGGMHIFEYDPKSGDYIKRNPSLGFGRHPELFR